MFTKISLILGSTDFSTTEFILAGLFIPFAILLFFLIKHFLLVEEDSPLRYTKKIRQLKYSNEQAHAALRKYFPYYQDLGTKQKTMFLQRVKEFMQIKAFIPRQTKPNETINLLIAATAVQLTFGLRDFSLYSFSKILIYPNTYYSEIRKVHHKGEINVQLKLIVLSAKHFLSGVKDPDDGINLGLHEMAHALNVHSFEEKDHQLINQFINWSDEAILEMANIEHSSNHFLRKYAATNIEEMFAVCTENFFERPEEFSKVLPSMYKKLMRLFNQDPRDHANPSGL